MSQIEEQLRQALGKKAPELLPADNSIANRTKLCLEACDGVSDTLLQDLDVSSVIAVSIEMERKVHLLLDLAESLCCDDLWSEEYYDRTARARKKIEQIRNEL